ncbi:MAG: class D sortase [Gammaproteobacteria bacterium]|nr:MAG: class D sortase [Gammaproteobacteria bacterium]
MKLIELVLWIAGITLLTIYLGAQAWGQSAGQRDLTGFVMAQQSAGTTTPSAASSEPDVDAVLAVLRIPGIDLEVPVTYGTSETVLRRGAGLIEGTAPPGTPGNVGIAAHRDTFFRGLEHIAVGDRIDLETLEGRLRYHVTGMSIVEPTEVHVLADTGEDVLTLVTCYPFYFVGHAPQRFIVRAAAADPSN